MYQYTARNPNGYAIEVGPEGKREFDTKQCCHCGGHFNIVPGSGTTRGFCKLCMKVTCGQYVCCEHYPIEERLDDYERGLLPSLMSPRSEALKSRIFTCS